ncbi:hypothetical protein P3S68_028677 [Capsicum galapagoense]
MPRFKRLPKKQKLGPSESTSQVCTTTISTSLFSIPSSSYRSGHFTSGSDSFPESQPSLSVHLTSHPSPVGRDSSQPSPVGRDSSQPSPVGRDSSHPYPVGRNSSQPSRSVYSITHLGLENQDSSQSSRHSRNNVKKIKVKAKQVLNLTSEKRIVVKFDVYDEPFGEARSLVLRFCGILACDCSLFPINFEKWSSLPMTYFNRVFEHIIKPKFFFDTAESIARRHVSLSIGKKWAANKINMWNDVDDPLKSEAQILDKKMRQKNHKNRQKQIIPHAGGSKANTTRRAEMMAETGQWPGRAQMYIATHMNQDGVYVNEAAKEICEKIKSALSQSAMDESQVSSNDAVGKVLGPEHSERVRCLGLGAVPSRVFKQDRPHFGGTSASSSGGSCSFQCR